MPTIFNDKGNMPGVYLFEEDVPGPIAGVGTSTAAFVGFAAEGGEDGKLLNEPTPLTNWTQFKEKFGESIERETIYSPYAVRNFFENGGVKCYFVPVYIGGKRAACDVKDKSDKTIFTVRRLKEGNEGNNYSLQFINSSLDTEVDIEGISVKIKTIEINNNRM